MLPVSSGPKFGRWRLLTARPHKRRARCRLEGPVEALQVAGCAAVGAWRPAAVPRARRAPADAGFLRAPKETGGRGGEMGEPRPGDPQPARLRGSWCQPCDAKWASGAAAGAGTWSSISLSASSISLSCSIVSTSCSATFATVFIERIITAAWDSDRCRTPSRPCSRVVRGRAHISTANTVGSAGGLPARPACDLGSSVSIRERRARCACPRATNWLCDDVGERQVSAWYTRHTQEPCDLRVLSPVRLSRLLLLE